MKCMLNTGIIIMHLDSSCIGNINLTNAHKCRKSSNKAHKMNTNEGGHTSLNRRLQSHKGCGFALKKGLFILLIEYLQHFQHLYYNVLSNFNMCH